jgi:hypothetical protein
VEKVSRAEGVYVGSAGVDAPGELREGPEGVTGDVNFAALKRSDEVEDSSGFGVGEEKRPLKNDMAVAWRGLVGAIRGALFAVYRGGVESGGEMRLFRRLFHGSVIQVRAYITPHQHHKDFSSPQRPLHHHSIV